eukprot:TRINITY_DN21608_c0_g1_i1.p1 TRINITY_DN21608_c0_g1~~TRINITY_DN21608_c0_g1_i1.p1  ORF type:complete len:555 (+),score=115.35 TRINITY_DN21608_c0_g1_i1:209-1873(+)
MPKLFLPPQGGEKWLCIFTFLFMMFSIVCTVVLIYCIVIIYIPSVNEGDTEYIGPKRCTTTLIERNVSITYLTDPICNWSSCEEWCLSKVQGTSPCSKMYGILREQGAIVSFEGCELKPELGFIDHMCTTAEDLDPINCKRSKYETSNPGRRETCVGYNNLISCQAGYCKNISKIWDCTYKDRLQDLLKDYGSKGQLEGWCNCRRCPESNTSIVEGVDTLTCPKNTEYCFLKTADPSTYNEKMVELCTDPMCETCYDICRDRRQCLDMKSRRDVVYFGVDEYDDPLLTYYQCQDGNCTEIYDMKCNRTCDDVKFNFEDVNVALLQGERVVMASCRKQLLNGTELLPANAVGNRDWNRLVASCSNITINEEMDSIMATDCLNGTWFDNLGIINYNTLTTTYEEYRSDERRWVKRNEDDSNLIPWEQDIVIYNETRILKNQEGCVNTLSMECMDFYHRYGRDGANYTARAVFDCYYNPKDEMYVVIDYQPDRTLFYLMLWSILPGCIMFVSCVYMCVCSKFMFIGDDGHMRIFCCGQALTGIGDVAVYKPPSKAKS